MKVSKEVRIGILVATAVLIFIAGFYFLKGSNLFKGEENYYAYYKSVQGLQPAAMVQVRGVAVGKVSKIELLNSDSVRVTISVQKDIGLPFGTVARMVSLDLLGSKALSLELGTSPDILPEESVIETAVESGVIDNLSHEIAPLITDVRHVIAVMDSVMTGIHKILNEQTTANLNTAVASLDITMKNFAELSQKLNREGAALQATIQNLNSITNNLAKNNGAIDQILDNANDITKQLKNAPIDETVRSLEKTSTEINTLLRKINQGQGTVGMAMNDKQLYSELTTTLNTLKSLMADVEAHPSKYINVTIFGRKKQ